MTQTVVLAYSGGLDTSVCVKWLAQRGFRVVAFMADVGQGEPGARAIRRAKIAGASQVIVRDLRREFLRDYCYRALKAHAVYEGSYALATALSRPLIARHLVDVAHRVKALSIAHGCTGKGNDQVRFEVTVRILDPALKIIAPVRGWEFRSREEEIDYCLRHKIPVAVKKRSPYSIDQNLWGTSIEAGRLEDPWVEPPADSYLSMRLPQEAAARPAYVTLELTRGVPTHVNGRRQDAVSLVAALNRLGAQHGVGRTDMMESRVIGIKSREIYEAPAATILLEAHQELERLVLDRQLLQMKQTLAIKYAELVYSGLWFTPLKAALDAFVDETQRCVTGEIRLRLFKGSCQIVARRSPHSLYRERLATYSAKDQFDQRASEGFIKLFGLPYEGGRSKVEGRRLKVEGGR